MVKAFILKCLKRFEKMIWNCRDKGQRSLCPRARPFFAQNMSSFIQIIFGRLASQKNFAP
jgi:hypothetical protein